jgi:hypothetical protein
VLQQWHLRRFGFGLIASQTEQNRRQNQNKRTGLKKNQREEARRAFRRIAGRKPQGKKTEFQTGGFPVLSFRRWQKQKTEIEKAEMGGRASPRAVSVA